MFKNYFKSSWRNLWKNKFYSAINIAGLAIGLAVGIMILLWTHDELSFDSFHKNAGDIYKINSHLGKGADESEDRRSDLPDRLTLSGPSEPHVERSVGRNTRARENERVDAAAVDGQIHDLTLVDQLRDVGLRVVDQRRLRGNIDLRAG